MKIGITSQNFRTITGHAGKARRFFVYEGSNGDDLTLVNKIDLPKDQTIHASSHTINSAEKHPIDDLDILITASCGDGFQRKMKSRGITLIKTSEQDPLVAAKNYMAGKTLAPPLVQVQA